MTELKHISVYLTDAQIKVLKQAAKDNGFVQTKKDGESIANLNAYIRTIFGDTVPGFTSEIQQGVKTPNN